MHLLEQADHAKCRNGSLQCGRKNELIGVGGLGRLPDTTAGEALVVRAVLEIRTSSCAKAAVWRLRFATPLESGSEARRSSATP